MLVGKVIEAIPDEDRGFEAIIHPIYTRKARPQKRASLSRMTACFIP